MYNAKSLHAAFRALRWLIVLLLSGTVYGQAVKTRWMQFDGTLEGGGLYQTYPVSADGVDVYIEVHSSKMSIPGTYSIHEESGGGTVDCGFYVINLDRSITFPGSDPLFPTARKYLWHEEYYGGGLYHGPYYHPSNRTFVVTGPNGYERHVDLNFETVNPGNHNQFFTGVWMTDRYMEGYHTEFTWIVGLEDPPTCPTCSTCGMANYSLDQSKARYFVTDTPLSYTPPRGPAISVTVNYRLHDPSQEETLTYSNFGRSWSSNLISYFVGGPAARKENLYLYQAGGGREEFAGWIKDDGRDEQPLRDTMSRSQYTRALPRWTGTEYQLELVDGSMQIFGFADKPGDPACRYFLTEVVDPFGNTLTFNYESLPDDGGARLVSMTDALGQSTAFSYELSGDPLKITKATDHAGRSAIFTYTPGGQLASSTDPVGIVSQCQYNSADDYLDRLITPYGTTKFLCTESAGSRVVTITNTQGAIEILQYLEQNPLIPPQEPTSQVPAVASAYNTGMDRNNSYYWTRQAIVKAQAAGATPGTAAFYDYAIAAHYLVNGNDATSVPASTKLPLETRVWTIYSDQDAPNDLSFNTVVRPIIQGRKMPNGQDQVYQAAYNDMGMTTEATDPLGRREVRTYAANGIDLLSTGLLNGSAVDTLATVSGYINHLPIAATDAAGQTTSYVYNSFGQILTATNALGHVTSFTYDTAGYRQSKAAPSGYTRSFTWDNLGRLTYTSNSDNYDTTYEYDALSRLTQKTYPDLSYETITYQNLLPDTMRDRMGRETKYTYDSELRLIAAENPSGNSVQFGYCICGAFNSLKDENGTETRWENDSQGRTTAKIYPDGSRIQYNYDSAGRLITTVDARAQVYTATYNVDNTLANASWTNLAEGVAATPSVTYTYDSTDRRLLTMTDGNGQTTYTYFPYNGQLGAGQVSQIQSPVAIGSSTVAYQYDELGRIISRSIDGRMSTYSFDSNDRNTGETNAIGTFTFSYDANSDRLAGIAYPNGITASYAYSDSQHDLQLAQIRYANSEDSILEQYDYTYNDVGNIIRWRQQGGGADASEWRLGYDATDKLLAADQVDAATHDAQRRWDYIYDRSGNRLGETVTDSAEGAVSPVLASSNNLNQLLTVSPGVGYLSIEGSTNKAATVTVNGQAVSFDSNSRFTAIVAAGGEGSTSLTITAVSTGTTSASKHYTIANASGSSKTLEWDLNGNLQSDGERSYEWNAKNQLIAINYIGTSPIKRSEFIYDGFDRRIALVEREGSTIVSDRRFVWDGEDLCEERKQDNTLAVRYFEQGEIQETSGGSVSLLYTLDHLGSVRGLYDQDGINQRAYQFDPWGERSKLSGSLDTRRGFAGTYQHSTSGLTLATYRVYYPSLGKWISRDPIEEEGGINIYSYALGNPLSCLDALGLDPKTYDKESAAAHAGGKEAMAQSKASANKWEWGGRICKKQIGPEKFIFAPTPPNEGVKGRDDGKGAYSAATAAPASSLGEGWISCAFYHYHPDGNPPSYRAREAGSKYSSDEHASSPTCPYYTTLEPKGVKNPRDSATPRRPPETWISTGVGTSHKVEGD